MHGQLVFPFGVRPAQGQQDFLVAPCNEQAFLFIERWPDWPARAVAFYGPSGSGKSHLAGIWLARGGGGNAKVVLEDVDALEPGDARDARLMALFEDPKTTLLLTGRTPPARWAVTLADLRSRFDSLLSFALWAPDDALLAALVRKHFADRQLEVPDAVVNRIVTHLERTPEAVAAFVVRADRKAWAEKRAITERLVLQLLESEEAA